MVFGQILLSGHGMFDSLKNALVGPADSLFHPLLALFVFQCHCLFMKKEEFYSLVKEAVLAIEPAATVIFYGSRVRREAGEDSDWDFLILLDGLADEDRKDRIRDVLYDLELNHGQIISSIIRGRREWETSPLCHTPFHENVERYGIVL